MKKQNLRWFLIKWFLILMAGMYLCGELLTLFFGFVGFPFLYMLLSLLDIRFVSEGSVITDLLHVLFYFVADLLPGGVSDWVSRKMGSGAWGIQVSVNAPYYGGMTESLLRFGVFSVVLFFLLLRMSPYLVGAFFYCRMVAGKIKELMEEEKEQQLAFDRRRNLLLSDIAHDIKTPITTICGYSRALAEGVAAEEKRRLIMGTRCGSIDPAIVPFLQEKKGYTAPEVDTIMNKKSGLLGICGFTDMRDVHAEIEKGNERAKLALEMLVRSIRKMLGAYIFLLDGKPDAIVFTAGIGENDPIVREKVCENLESVGIRLDTKENDTRKPGARTISAPDSRIPVLVIPTDEELEIAEATVKVVEKK